MRRLPAALAVAATVPLTLALPVAAQTPQLREIRVSCAGLGQVALTVDDGQPLPTRLRLVGSSGVRLVTPAPLVGIDRRTGARVRLGAAPTEAVACTSLPVGVRTAREALPGPGALPPGVRPDDVLDDVHQLVAVVVDQPSGPAFAPRATTAASLPTFPFDAALRSFLAGRPGLAAAAVYDRQNGTTWAYAPTRSFVTASVVKVDILATLLRQAQLAGRSLTANEHNLANSMIKWSDNDAASTLWWQVGGGPGIDRFDRLAGLSATTPGGEGYWGLTRTTAPDRVALLRTIAYDNPVLSQSSRAVALDLMRGVVPAQSWGVTAGVPSGARVAVKNGWLPLTDGWHVNSTGHVTGGGLDYAVAVLSTGTATQAQGVATLEGVSRIIAGQLPRPAPSLAGASPTALHLVRRTDTGALEHVVTTTAPTAEPLGGLVVGRPAVTTVAGGLMVFARGNDDGLWWRQQRLGVWSPWARLPGRLTSAPAAVTGGDGTPRVFFRGSDGSLYGGTIRGAATTFQSLGGRITSAPSACRLASGETAIAAVGTDHRLWRGKLGAAWSGWSSVGGDTGADPAVACGRSGAEYFVRSIDGALRWRADGAAGWTALGGRLTSGPAVAWRGSVLDVVVLGTDGRSWRRTRTGASWSGWSLLR